MSVLSPLVVTRQHPSSGSARVSWKEKHTSSAMVSLLPFEGSAEMGHSILGQFVMIKDTKILAKFGLQTPFAIIAS
jgi:hypothetical protein